MDLENLDKAYEIKQKLDRMKVAAEKLEHEDCKIVVKGFYGDEGTPLGKDFIPEVKRIVFAYMDALMETAKTL